MSVRVTERLIGDVVIAPGLPNSPKMVVQSINEDAKLVTAVWFSDSREYEEGVFPGSALDRFEAPQASKASKTVKTPKAVKGKKPAPAVRGRKAK